jgi:hypothetical protein
MPVWDAHIFEICQQTDGLAAWIECPPAAIPAPGQYVMADFPGDVGLPTGIPLFQGDISPRGFLAAPPIPAHWGPGSPLKLRGPLGRGFHLPAGMRHLALAALGDVVSRLIPLIPRNADVALFTDTPRLAVPLTVEIHPLCDLAANLPWADFLALDIPLAALPNLRHLLGQEAGLPCPAQALIFAPMPCGSLADCGACAVPARRAFKLACCDGPVFPLTEISW